MLEAAGSEVGGSGVGGGGLVAVGGGGLVAVGGGGLVAVGGTDVGGTEVEVGLGPDPPFDDPEPDEEVAVGEVTGVPLVSVGATLGTGVDVAVDLKVGMSPGVLRGSEPSWSPEAAPVSKIAAVAGAPAGKVASSSVDEAVVASGVGSLPLELLSSKTTATAAPRINNKAIAPTTNQIAPPLDFSGPGWATTGPAAAATGAAVVVMLAAAGAAAAAAAPGTGEIIAAGALPGICNITTVILSRPPAALALSINSDEAVGKS